MCFACLVQIWSRIGPKLVQFCFRSGPEFRTIGSRVKGSGQSSGQVQVSRVYSSSSSSSPPSFFRKPPSIFAALGLWKRTFRFEISTENEKNLSCKINLKEKRMKRFSHFFSSSHSKTFSTPHSTTCVGND